MRGDGFEGTAQGRQARLSSPPPTRARAPCNLTVHCTMHDRVDTTARATRPAPPQPTAPPPPYRGAAPSRVPPRSGTSARSEGAPGRTRPPPPSPSSSRGSGRVRAGEPPAPARPAVLFGYTSSARKQEVLASQGRKPFPLTCGVLTLIRAASVGTVLYHPQPNCERGRANGRQNRCAIAPGLAGPPAGSCRPGHPAIRPDPIPPRPRMPSRHSEWSGAASGDCVAGTDRRNNNKHKQTNACARRRRCLAGPPLRTAGRGRLARWPSPAVIAPTRMRVLFVHVGLRLGLDPDLTRDRSRWMVSPPSSLVVLVLVGWLGAEGGAKRRARRNRRVGVLEEVSSLRRGSRPAGVGAPAREPRNARRRRVRWRSACARARARPPNPRSVGRESVPIAEDLGAIARRPARAHLGLVRGAATNGQPKKKKKEKEKGTEKERRPAAEGARNSGKSGRRPGRGAGEWAGGAPPPSARFAAGKARRRKKVVFFLGQKLMKRATTRGGCGAWQDGRGRAAPHARARRSGAARRTGGARG